LFFEGIFTKKGPDPNPKSGSVQIMANPDPDQGGPKTNRCYGSGSTALVQTFDWFFRYVSTTGFTTDFGEPEISNMDISSFVMFCVQVSKSTFFKIFLRYIMYLMIISLFKSRILTTRKGQLVQYVSSHEKDAAT
jgi:hypothetical protein